MTKYHIKWQLNPLTKPEDPEKRVKLWISMLEMIKAELKSGRFTDFGAYPDITCGYCVGEGTETDVFASLLKWTPYVIFDAKPILNVDQVIGEINKAMAGQKAK
jgi:hypothetical protein